MEGFSGWGGVGGDFWLVSSCLLVARKTVLAKGTASEGSAFGFGLANVVKVYSSVQNSKQLCVHSAHG